MFRKLWVRLYRCQHYEVSCGMCQSATFYGFPICGKDCDREKRRQRWVRL